MPVSTYHAPPATARGVRLIPHPLFTSVNRLHFCIPLTAHRCRLLYARISVSFGRDAKRRTLCGFVDQMSKRAIFNHIWREESWTGSSGSDPGRRTCGQCTSFVASRIREAHTLPPPSLVVIIFFFFGCIHIFVFHLIWRLLLALAFYSVASLPILSLSSVILIKFAAIFCCPGSQL